MDFSKLHRLSMSNWGYKDAGGKAACFQCLKWFSASEVNSYAQERDGSQTALCPRCGVDAVLFLSSQEFTSQELEGMHAVYFAPPAILDPEEHEHLVKEVDQAYAAELSNLVSLPAAGDRRSGVVLMGCGIALLLASRYLQNPALIYAVGVSGAILVMGAFARRFLLSRRPREIRRLRRELQQAAERDLWCRPALAAFLAARPSLEALTQADHLLKQWKSDRQLSLTA